MAAPTKTLYEEVDAALDVELAKHSIRAMSSYGWLDAYTEDPEMIGHAMWQVSPPADVGAQLADSTEPEVTSYERQLMVIGADFEGLMELARTSLGIVLWRRNDAAADHTGDNPKFWAHYTGALLTLSMASDRLRDFFVIAYFRKNFSSYMAEKQHFMTPFVEAVATPKSKVGAQIAKLQPLMGEIQKRRSIRNRIVHEVATRPGEMNKQIFEKRRPRTTATRDVKFVDVERAWGEWHKREAKKLKDGEGFLLAWYKDLIEASSLVFEVEHWLRKAE